MITFDAGFFSVTSPAKQIIEDKTMLSTKPSIHKTILSSEMKRRLSMTPSNTAAILAVSSIERRVCLVIKKIVHCLHVFKIILFLEIRNVWKNGSNKFK